MTIWLDVETNKALLRLRDIKAVREVSNGKQRTLPGWERCKGGNIK
jgi:hypothetical protein